MLVGIDPNQDVTNVTYEEIHTVLIDYPQNSQVATLLQNSPASQNNNNSDFIAYGTKQTECCSYAVFH
jgi:hypothetical protein